MHSQEHRQAVEKVRKMLKGIPFAMLTTIDSDERLHGRPMATQELDEDGCLWFFTGKSSTKVGEIENHQQVNLSYVKEDDHRYVSISGSAERVLDRAKMKALWHPTLMAWFPDGLEDPELCLLKVHVEHAEYWDTASSRLVQVVGFVKALVSGKRAEVGHHENVAFEPPSLH